MRKLEIFIQFRASELTKDRIDGSSFVLAFSLLLNLEELPVRQTHIEQGFFDVLTASADGLPIRTHRRLVKSTVLIKLGPFATGSCSHI